MTPRRQRLLPVFLLSAALAATICPPPSASAALASDYSYRLDRDSSGGGGGDDDGDGAPGGGGGECAGGDVVEAIKRRHGAGGDDERGTLASAVARCLSVDDPAYYLKCPLTCSGALEPVYPMVQGRNYREEQFYEIRARTMTTTTTTMSSDDDNNDETTKNRNAPSTIDFERFEGLNTVVAFLPVKYEGMVEYNLRFIDVLMKEEPFRSACLVVPYVEQTTEKEREGAEVQEKAEGRRLISRELEALLRNSRCAVLEPYESEKMGDHPLVGFLDSAKRSQPKHQLEVQGDRPLLFVVNHDAALVERRVAPSLTKMRALLKHYYGIMDKELN